MKYLAGIDLGTSATKIIIMNKQGTIVSSVSKSYPLSNPENGWAEQEPEDWKRAVLEGLNEVVVKAGLQTDDIKGIGLSGQMHGVVMLDHAGKPLRSSIIWCDQRTERQVQQMQEIMSVQQWLDITANPPLAAWSAAKILWIKEHQPEIYARCAHILLPKDYIRYILTGSLATDVSDASGTQLLNVEKRNWSQEVLDKLGIDRRVLPEVFESHEITGWITADIAAETGLAEGTIVAAGASDNAAAAVGMGTVETGDAFVSIGTSAIIYSHMEEYKQVPEGSLHVCCGAVAGCWHTMGGPQAAGLSLKWFTDNFCHEYMDEAKKQDKGVYDIINKKVSEVPPGSNRLIYMPYLMGERTPHMNPDCRGVFIGLNAVHTKANLLRAVMEGVGYSMADCSDVQKAVGIRIQSMRICGGGSRSKVWTQILADMLNCDIIRMKQDEGPAFGAAILAGVAAGVYSDVKTACRNLLSEKNCTVPVAENTRIYEEYHKVYQKIYKDIVDNFKTLALLN